jgi:hypothetical protein
MQPDEARPALRRLDWREREAGTKSAHTRHGMLDSVTTGHLGCPWGQLETRHGAALGARAGSENEALRVTVSATTE